MKRLCVLGVALALVSSCLPGAQGDQGQSVMSPKEVVDAFNQMAFFDHKPVEAVKKYIDPDFVEHDPTTASGRDALIAYFENRDWSSNKMQDKIYRTIAEGDLVVVHHHIFSGPDDRGLAAVDIFRVENGLVVEHWDVMQPVPETAANDNGMF